MEENSDRLAILNNGVSIPLLGYGTYLLNKPKETIESILCALEAGYRSIDTASFYNNEKYIGKALKESGLKRKELFITTKIWNTEQVSGKIEEAFTESLEKLDCSYLDMYLIHWPVTNYYLKTWDTICELYEKKLIRSIGVSNFTIVQLEKLLNHSNIVPVLNQVEYHPYLQQKELHTFCIKNKIQLEAWRPLMYGDVIKIEDIKKLAKKYNKTEVQIVLRWNLQKKVVTIPKSKNKKRIIENAQLFDFNLSSEDMKIIEKLDRNYRLGPDPATMTF